MWFFELPTLSTQKNNETLLTLSVKYHPVEVIAKLLRFSGPAAVNTAVLIAIKEGREDVLVMMLEEKLLAINWHNDVIQCCSLALSQNACISHPTQPALFPCACRKGTPCCIWRRCMNKGR